MALIEPDPRDEPTVLIELFAPLPLSSQPGPPPGMVVPDNREHGVSAGWFEAAADTEDPADFVALRHRFAAAA